MRMFCFLISVGFVSLLMPRETLAQDTQEGTQEKKPDTGSVGDCLVPDPEFSSCEDYLTKIGKEKGL